MPTRILREGILTSERVNKLTVDAELFYRRLMSVVDDYGRYFSHVSILRANCYPMRLEDISEKDIKRYLGECVEAGLIVIYDAGKHLQLLDFHQQTRSKSKFPQPSENELLSKCKADAKQMLSLDGVGDVVEGEGGDGAKEADAKSMLQNKIIEAWNKTELPKCLTISDKRKQSLSARLKEPFFLANWEAALRKVTASKFCTGNNERGWKADIDWFLQPESVLRAMEGKYDNQKPVQTSPARDPWLHMGGNL